MDAWKGGVWERMKVAFPENRGNEQSHQWIWHEKGKHNEGFEEKQYIFL